MPRLAATTLCLAALAPTGAGQAANPAFRISIDRDSWRQFGWRYPATYVFQLSGEVQELTASRRDGSGDLWTPLAPKPPGESLNGVEGFRVDPETRRAYVSVGFKSLPTIYLTFSGAEQVEFVEIARYFEHILTCGYYDDSVLATSARQFVLVRGYNSRDNPTSVDYASWDTEHGFYGVGGLSYKAYDAVFQRRRPAGRYYREDVEALNAAFDEVHGAGQIFYAMWHPDRYQNSVIHDVRPPIEGVQGSSLVQHLEHLARRTDVWYAANGWLHCYRYVAENARVERQP